MKEGENIRGGRRDETSELAILSSTIRSNLQKIMLQNRRIQEEKERTLRAEYHALESQLDPHMLYNTLSVIGMTALADGSRKAAVMCGELAELLRYSVSFAGQTVSMADEIENVNHYMDIMKARYEDMLEYETDLDEGADKVMVPKLILQPVVENCFKHGFKNCAVRSWRVFLSFRADAERWMVTIRNNGNPFAEEAAAKLTGICDIPEKEAFEFSQNILFGHGLENTIYRLHIHYRGKEIVQIRSSEVFTEIFLSGPIGEAPTEADKND
ncbi:sensor histidine kinase [Lachnoclostridium sp. Marseille-P6806]|uniref:sensor histidine kinase n=1 Tax=Lachnoclostridium sp. Marseille-P6806 TaxID=2364793 RepID=UPI0013EF1868|nr:histidine kinase [Lachnoclostridium sp. Marseille-P6806]